MNFRKGIFALAVAGLGLTGIASAQVTCSGGTATPSFLRAEGTTELLPAILIGGSGCSVGATNPGTISIVVSTTAGVTNLATSSSNANTDALAGFNGSNPVAGQVVGNTIAFNNIPVPTPGNNGSLPALVIANVRVNASSVPPNTNVTASVSGTSGVILSNASNIVVGFTQPGVAKPVVAGYTNTAICSAGTNAVPLLEAEIVSGFPGAFSPESNGTTQFSAVTGDLFVVVNFGGLVNGVNYYVPISPAGLSGVTAATLVSANTVPNPPAVTGVSIPSSSNAQIQNVAQLSVSNGSASAMYHLTGLTAGATQAFIVTLYAVTTSSATAGTTTAPTVSANLIGPTKGYDQFSSTQTPTAVSASNNPGAGTPVAFTPSVTIGSTTYKEATSTSLGELTSCTTTLLFPYVVNTGGYDTGIALTNASASGSGSSSVAQAGTCSMQFFGNNAPSTNPYVTPTVNAGSVTAFTLSSVASGFQGYAVATCNFQNAHGFAFIADGYGQAGRGLSQGYLAIVTSASGVTVSNASF